MLIEWIKNEMGVTYQKAQIYNILKRLGYSYQRGKGVFPEADKQQQEVFKEALKKLIESPRSVLLFEDECSLSNTATIGYQWSKRESSQKY